MSGKQKELREKELREKLQDKGKDEYYSFYSNPLFNCDNSLSKGLEEVLPKEECKVLCYNPLFISNDSLLKGLEEQLSQEERETPMKSLIAMAYFNLIVSLILLVILFVHLTMQFILI